MDQLLDQFRIWGILTDALCWSVHFLSSLCGLFFFFLHSELSTKVIHPSCFSRLHGTFVLLNPVTAALRKMPDLNTNNPPLALHGTRLLENVLA